MTREFAQYSIGHGYGRTVEIYMMLMSKALAAIDDGTDEFVAVLVRPEGSVRVVFRPETLKLQDPEPHGPESHGPEFWSANCQQPVCLDFRRRSDLTSTCHCFYSCNCRTHPASCHFPHRQYVYAQKPGL